MSSEEIAELESSHEPSEKSHDTDKESHGPETTDGPSNSAERNQSFERSPSPSQQPPDTPSADSAIKLDKDPAHSPDDGKESHDAVSGSHDKTSVSPDALEGSAVKDLPVHSPTLYTSGDDPSPTADTYPLPHSPSCSPEPPEDTSMSVLFEGITYLGCSSVDAPVSEVEANRKMYTLKTQAESTEPMPVILSIPISNNGNVILKDPGSEQPLSIFAVKMILFCARGNAEQLLDCFCLNVKHKRSGIYRCHAFRCEVPEDCQSIFEAIGTAFKTKPRDRNLPPLSGSDLSFRFKVRLEIAENDGKGHFTPVSYEKDCFKLRQGQNKKVTLSVSQEEGVRPILVERCFGLLISSVAVVKGSEMNLLDNMMCSAPDNNTFSVTGLWDSSSHHLTDLNQDTKVLGYKYITVAADLVLESVAEPVRFKREVKVSIKSSGGMAGLQRSLNLIKIKKNNSEVFDCSQSLRLSLVKKEEGPLYSVGELVPVHERAAAETDHGRETQERKRSVSQRETELSDDEGAPVTEPRDLTEEDEVIISGWGDVDDTREDLLADWGAMLEDWDGRDKPSKLVKLCSKGIPRHLRCQVWQMLSGASSDPQLQEAYRLLLTKESPAENVINWDIKRTYVGHGYFQDPAGREALYKICKAYSVYDEEVGYCQGFSFMAATLLLQKMPEEEAFSVMVKILFQYGHRDLFKENFQHLHLMFFQLDRLMEEQLSKLFEHFKENRIETHMFASQWFLTLYTAKFPLSLVFRIVDIYLCEGVTVIFRVALGLLKTVSHDLLSLDFEGILNYFRVSLPKKFQSEEDAAHLFHHMKNFKVSEKKLAKFEKEHLLHLEQQAQMEDPAMRLERDNKVLRESVMRLEGENDNLAQELVASKVTLRQEMDRLEERIDTLSKESRAHKTSADLSQHMLKEVREELQQAKEEYQKVMVQLMEEKMQHDAAISEYKQVFQQLDEGHQKEKGELNQELLEVKAQLGKTVQEPSGTDAVSSLSSEERLRKLELELAQTKLALVESQCKNQELERSVQHLSAQSIRFPWKKK